MGLLFKGKEELELDSLIARLESNMSNNYKDAAQADFRELETAMDEMIASGRLKGRAKSRYEAKRTAYQEKLRGYSHKDQKPFWT